MGNVDLDLSRWQAVQKLRTPKEGSSHGGGEYRELVSMGEMTKENKEISGTLGPPV